MKLFETLKDRLHAELEVKPEPETNAYDLIRKHCAQGLPRIARTGRSSIARARSSATPSKPSIAVLPFQNLSGDPEQEYFADGMVEEIITALSRMRWLFVIARNSSFTYKGRAMDVRQVGRELGVRYVLEGSVRKAANRVRIAGQLLDTSTGAHLWADRFEGSARRRLRSAGPGDDECRRRHRAQSWSRRRSSAPSASRPRASTPTTVICAASPVSIAGPSSR